MTITEEYNINKNIISQRLGASSEFGGEKIFQIKAVYRKRNEGPWKLCAALIQRVNEDGSELTEQYKENAFFVKYRKFSKVSDILFNLFEIGIDVSSEYPPIKIDEMKYWKESLIPSISSPTGYPTRHLVTNIESCNYGDEPLIGYKLPYYESFYARLKEFIKYEKNENYSIHLLLEDSRAALEIKDEKVILNTKENVSLVGQINRNEKIEKTDMDNISFKPIDISKASFVEIWVIDENNLILDYISSTAFPYHYEILKDEKTLEEYIQEKIENGETIDCEFKKCINFNKGDSKAIEIDKTVCAFSNTKGGDLIIGVSDNGEVIGVDEDVRKIYKSNLYESTNDYINAVNKRLYENLTVNDCFTVNSVNIFGKTLIVVKVTKSNVWNFLQSSDIAYKRKGSTSFTATRLVALDYESNKENLNNNY